MGNKDNEIKDNEILDKELNEETLENVSGGVDPTPIAGDHGQSGDDHGNSGSIKRP